MGEDEEEERRRGSKRGLMNAGLWKKNEVGREHLKATAVGVSRWDISFWTRSADPPPLVFIAATVLF